MLVRASIEAPNSIAAMNDLDRLHQILPFAAALFLLTGTAQIQATQPAVQHAPSGFSVERVVAGAKWHMLQIAKNERNEALAFYPGN